MEEKFNELRYTAARKKEMADANVLREAAKHPQRNRNLPIDLIPTDPCGLPDGTKIPGCKPTGGGAAGLARVVGAGKAGKMRKAREEMEMDYDGASDGSMKGKMFRDHLTKMYGGAFVESFLKGAAFTPDALPLAPKGAIPNLPGTGSNASAPASFRRNTVGMGRPAGAGMCGGCDAKGAVPCGGAKGGDMRVARGQLIRKLMQEKGMTLPQASKYIKENRLL